MKWDTHCEAQSERSKLFTEEEEAVHGQALLTNITISLACKLSSRYKARRDSGEIVRAAREVRRGNESSPRTVCVQVCPDSAKVQLNSGILERRHKHWEEALTHFQRAREIEPGYCEPSYWIGITIIATGSDTGRAIEVSLKKEAYLLASREKPWHNLGHKFL